MEVQLNPIDQIADLLGQLKALDQPAPICLSTMDAEGFPNARFVDLKGVLNSELLFGTDERSTKATEFLSVPAVSLCAWWEVLQVQIRVTGIVRKASAAISDEVFSDRNITAKAIAITSRQSMPLNDLKAFQSMISVFLLNADTEIARPPTWWVYAVLPREIEILKFSADRIHVRTKYLLKNGAWLATHLSP